jgi:SAM-dependent methyltransferase
VAETAKARERRLASGFFDEYVKGRGLDIGCGNDPLTPDCDTFEKIHPDNGSPSTSGQHFTGDAHTLPGVPRDAYDWVNASHILEHLEDPVQALRAWFSVVKPGGVLIISVPHRDYYERKRLLPSNWNGDHKSFWLPVDNDPPHTWGLWSFVEDALGRAEEFERWQWQVEPTEYVLESDRTLPSNLHAQGEYSIECVVRKL